MSNTIRTDTNVLALVKGRERYIFLYDDQSHEALYNIFDKYAKSPDMNFDNSDARSLRERVERRERFIGGP